MGDLLYPLGTLAFFALMLGYVRAIRGLLKDLWGASYADQSHYVRVYMAQLRQKIEADPTRPRLLITEPGVGYRLRDE
jgi:two-component system, OmpR family, KDP operon response regulator KdpE